MSNSPLISVIVPFFNSEAWLDDCIKSIVEQTYSKLEIILVNDGCTDNSVEIAKKWRKIDKRIIVLSKQNGGVSSARNLGLENCKGDYITFVDSDDTTQPNMYEELLSFSGKAEIICCGINRYTIEGEIICLNNIDKPKFFSAEEAICSYLRGNGIACSVYDKLFKRELFDGVRFPEGRLMEEAVVLPNLFKKANGIVHIGKSLYNYKYRPNSYTTKPLCKECYFVYETIELYQEQIVPTYPSVQKALNEYRYRQCLMLYRRAIRQRKEIEEEVYERAKTEFNNIWAKALFCMGLTLKERLQVLQTKFRIFM